jgi:hypothetical protein
MYKFITKLFLIGTAYFAPFAEGERSDGWVSLAPTEKRSFSDHGIDQEDPLIWVLFAKQLGDENFMVRFPVEPKYHYISQDEMEISAASTEGYYSLRVLNAMSSDAVEAQIQEVFMQTDVVMLENMKISENRWEIAYQKEGKWISQTFFLHFQHLYIFQTEDVVFHRENHQKFVASLDVALLQK